MTPANSQNAVCAPLRLSLSIRALRKNTKPSGASMMTQASGELNMVAPNPVIPVIAPLASVTTDICAVTQAVMPVSARPEAI